MTIRTIGHSTHAIADFLEILKAHGIQHLIDIRTVPHSRHNPQFNRENLRTSLDADGLQYTHMPELGGLRRSTAESINTGWKNASFRGYADYMQTQEFAAGIDRLIELGAQEQVAIMCAEAVPWRCHRSLVSDALLARDIAVEHILSATSVKQHTFTPFARIDGVRVTFPRCR